MQQNKSNRHGTQLRYFIAFVFALFYVMRLHDAWASTLSEQPDQPNTLCHGQIQSYHIAQNFQTHSIDQPSDHWQVVQRLPDYWNKRWHNFEESAWYKIKIDYRCPTPQKQPMTLVIEHLNLAGQVYLNQELLWESHSIHPPLSRHLHQPLKWVLPSSSLKLGENTVLVHVFGVSTQQSGLGQMYFGHNIPMSKKFDRIYLERHQLPLFNIAVNLVISIFCFMVWSFYRKDLTFLWFSLTSLFWSLYSIMVITNQPWPIFSNLFFDQLQLFIFCAYTFFGCISIWRFAGKKFPFIEKAIIGFYSLAALIILILPDIFQAQAHISLFIIAVTIFIVKAITYPFVIHKTQHKEAYWILVNQMLFLPIAFNDAYYMLTHEGHILSPYTAPFTSTFIGFVLALRLSKNSKRIQSFNKTLERSILIAKQELTLSLNKQHQLALDNVKLQQRIQLSHDLHDGLGGSIVRAMALLDHNRVDQNQMKSILKLLRSDLRQIIDSASSLGDKSPDTPILWMAPLRHRFIQVLDDLDIQSEWIIPEQWLIPPPALYCMTLSRVAEEALTNIIKHSRATQVTVRFEQDWQHHLILIIQDNGVGFDAQHVQPNLHVGLHSMQMRIQRLGGVLKIQSEEHCTQISAQLNTQRILDNGENV